MNRTRILDAHSIRESTRELIRRIKKSNDPDETIVLTRFLKEVEREISSYLLASGYKMKQTTGNNQ